MSPTGSNAEVTGLARHVRSTLPGERSALLSATAPGRSAGDAEAADAIQIDRIEFIASPSFDIRIGF